MSKVLDYFRTIEPRFKEVGDNQLTEFIAAQHPEFLQDPEFNQRVAVARNPPSLQMVSPFTPTAPALPAAIANEPLPAAFDNAKLSANADRVAAAEAQQQQADLESSLQYHPLYQASRVLGQAGRVTLAGAADLAATATGQPAENLASYANRPDKPMPVEEGLNELKVVGDGFWNGMAALGAKTSAALLKTAPALAAGAVGVAAGAPAAQANALAFGLATEEGGFDPVGAVIAAGLPGVTKAGEAGVAKLLEKLPVSGVVIEALSKATPKLKGKVIQKLGNIELSNDQFRKVLEAGGGLLAANAYLNAMAVPEILALPPEQQKEAALEMVASNLAMSLSGLTSRKGTSLTLENLTPKLRAEWMKANAPQARPSPRMQLPSEEGAPVPATENISQAIAARPPKTPVPPPPPSPPTPPPAPPGTPPTPVETPNTKPQTPPTPPEPPPTPPTPPPPTPPTPPKPPVEPVVQGTMILGRPVKVKGQGGVETPARYAFVPFSDLHASHTGEMFNQNPAYAPLVNTRDYAKDPSEQEKILLGAQNFDPAEYVTHGISAALGPIMVAPGEDGVLRVLGGNGRKQMLDRMSPEKWRELSALQREEAATFGLPANLPDGGLIVRLLPNQTLATPEGLAAAHRLVDVLNPSPGLGESTSKLAENDALNLPAEALLAITPTSTTGMMRDWMSRLLADGLVDRNTRTRITKSDDEVRNYVSRVIIHAAYRDNTVSNLRNDPYAPATIRDLIDGASSTLIRLRQLGVEGTPVADAWSELFRRVAELQKKYPDQKINRTLQLIADQAEVIQTPELALGRGLAMALASRVTFLPMNKRGEMKVDSDETSDQWRELLESLNKTINNYRRDRDEVGGQDIFGGQSSLLDSVRNWLRSQGGADGAPKLADLREPAGDYSVSDPRLPALPDGDAAGRVWRWVDPDQVNVGDLVRLKDNQVVPVTAELLPTLGSEVYALRDNPNDQAPSGPDPRVARYKALERLRLKLNGKLPQELETEQRAIEEGLGQHFLAFFAQETSRPPTPDPTAAEIEARMKRRLVAGPLENQGGMFDNLAQTSLFSPSSDYLPGFGTPTGENPNAVEPPKTNPPIEGPAAKLARANRELGIDGGRRSRPEPGGPGAAAAGPPAVGFRKRSARKEVIWTRRELIPKRGAFHTEWIPRKSIAAKLLDSHQKEGVNRALDVLATTPLLGQQKAFGLFDGTGAGKTMQEVVIADLLAARTGKPVLIITERQNIIDDAFAKDAETLGVPIHQWRGGPIEKDQRVLMATFFDLGLGKIPTDQFENIIFDEAHNLRNTDKAAKSQVGLELANSAKRILYATATPLDQPQQLYYLKSLLSESPERALARIGVQVAWRTVQGRLAPVFTYMEGVTAAQVEANLERVFDDVYRHGKGIKREVPLDNLDVFLKVTRITPEEAAEVNDIMAKAEAFYILQGVPASLVVGLKMMIGRQALEKFKAQQTIEMIQKAITAGKKVLVYGYRVQDGLWVDGGGLEAMANQLESIYGRGSVGRLFGGGNGKKAAAYKADVLERYQHGDLKIIVAHPQQGGTGINADDIYGDAPRVMFLITPPFSALEGVQLAGRHNRLTTKSRAELQVMLTNHPVDRWNIGIYLQKLRNLHASVKGDVDQLSPTNPIHETGLPYQVAEGGRKAHKPDPRQLEFAAFAGIASLGRFVYSGQPQLGGTGTGLPPNTTPAQAQAVALTASIVREQYVANRKFNFLGMDCRNIEEAAVIMQAIRSKSVESTVALFVGFNGEVKGQYVVTKHLPDQSSLVPEGKGADYIRQMAADSGAAFVFIGHNHPSGEVIPSEADHEVTEYCARELGTLFGGHIVMNHRRYAVIDKWGQESYHDIPGPARPDPLLQSANLPGVGTTIPSGFYKTLTPQKVAAHFAGMQHDPEALTLLFVNARNRTTAAGYVRAAAIKGVATKLGSIDKIRQMARDVGAVKVFGYFDGMVTQARSDIEALIRSGALTDAFVPNGGLSLSLASEMVADGWNPWGDSAWLGLSRGSTGHPTTQLAEESGDYLLNSGLEFSRGAYGPNQPPEKGQWPRHISVTLGGMKDVHPVEMPEILKLVQQIGGDLPKLKKMKSALGQFNTGTGKIQLDPRIFKDPAVAAKVLAHELGHMIDWLPDRYIQRGNLLGRLFTLRNFLKNTFGATSVTNKELRAELIAVTQHWKPYNPAAVPPSYHAYRQSAVELYADALSVLLNSPGTLQRLAPKFYNEFWDAINRKRDVKAALFGMQDFLSKGRLPIMEARQEDVLAGFEQGEAMWRAAVAEREAARKSWKGWWTRLGQELYWQYFPLEQRAAQVEKAGKILPPARDPRVFLDDLGYRDTTVMAWGRTIFEKVIQPIEAADITLEQAGLYLFWQRVLNGDRSVLANPYGNDTLTARAGMLKMRLDLGIKKMTLLEAAMDRFHEEVFGVLEQAYEAGAINKKVWLQRIVPNKEHYATFAVLDYLDDYIPPGIKQQIGTFKGIGNPFHATILKTIGTINLVAYQRAKNLTVSFLKEHFPDEIEKWAGEHEAPFRKGSGKLMKLENGAPAWYYVDPYVADAFEKLNPRQLWWFTRAADGIFRRIIYPLIITYNPAFLYFMSPMRDIQRTSRNLPGVRFSVGTLPVEYAKQLGQTADRYAGTAGPLIREMEANLGLGTPFDQITRQHRDDFMADLLKRMRVLPDHEMQGWYQSLVFTPVRKLLDGLELGGMTLDTLAKTASYARLRQQGMHPRQAGQWVRNNAGLPNINKKGLMVRQVRALVPFWNVAMQGWRADLKNMTHPTTRGGWWLRYIMSNGLLRALLALGATGALGAALKELFAGIGEYDKTNYLSIPVGQTEGGDFGNKTAYIRLPESESDRLIGGIISKTIRAMGPDDPRLTGIFDFGMGQFPSFNPALSVPMAWAQYAAGHNPTDPLRGKDIVPAREWTAGGWDSLEPMALWTIGQTGVPNFIRWDPMSQSTWELSLSAIPGVNKFVKVSDQGYREQQRSMLDEVAAAKAHQFLRLPAQVQSIEMEYWRLAKIPAEARTIAQSSRYEDLHYWYQRTYRPAWENIQQAVEDKQPAAAESLRKQLDSESATYYRSGR